MGPRLRPDPEETGKVGTSHLPSVTVAAGPPKEADIRIRLSTGSAVRPRPSAAIARAPARVPAFLGALVAALAMTLAGPPAAAIDAPAAAAVTCPASLQALLDATPSGGKVTVPPCTYRETVTINKPLTLRGYGATISGKDAAGTTVRPAWVIVNASDVTVEGFTMRDASNAAQTGAVRVKAGISRFTLHACDLGYAAGANVSIGVANSSVIEGCAIHHGGQEGVHMGGDGTNGRNNVLRNNRIYANNTAGFDPGWEAGGVKATRQTGLLMEGNEVYDNAGPGLWCDIDCRSITVRDNRVHHNDREGILFEISSGARISGNAVWNNGYGFAAWGWGAGISVSSSDRADVVGNTVAWNARGISVISQGRELAPNDHNTVHENVVVSAVGDGVVGWYDDKDGSLFSTANANTGSGNRYWIGAAEPTAYRFGWAGGQSTLAAFNATPGEEGGTYLTDAERDAALGAAGIPAEDGTLLPGSSAGDLRVSVALGRIGTTGVPATISWSPIALADAYRVQLQRDGGGSTTLRLSSPASRSVAVDLATGSRYLVRLRHRTPPATWSAWSAPALMTPARYEETTSLGAYRGTWRRVASTGASGGYVRYATTPGATAAFRFTGRAVAWIAPVGPTRGSARVYVDGRYRTTVNLHRSSADVRRVVYRAAWTASGAHTVEIHVVGTTGHPRVDVDAFAVIR